MTKRRLERDVAKVSDQLLTELEPVVRIRCLLEAHARGKDRWIDRLHKTCPPAQRPAVVMAVQLALLWAYKAVYDLHTTALWLELLKTTQRAVITVDLERDEEPPEDRVEQAADRAAEIRAQFATLYIAYHSQRRFATDGLGIDLETWLTLHPNGQPVIELVEAVLDDPTQQRLAAAWLADEAALTVDEPATDALDEYVEREYETRIATWRRLLRTASGGIDEDY